VVVKRFRSWDRREPVREWTALILLAESAPGLAGLGEAGANASELTRQVAAMLTAQLDLDSHGLVRRAWQAGADWFRGGPLDRLDAGDPVLGQGDSNLANFLWDGTEVRIVDFEDSGPSDRAFELADLVEHISAWPDASLPADVVLGSFGLTAAKQVRVREYRRLCALFWLVMLLPGRPGRDRNPAGTLERQAARLLLPLGR
jgi:aminoglycoside phosphotransferase (APT) family kinase protein